MAAKKSTPHYVLLGGAGAMGQITARDLSETLPAGATVVLADYHLDKAQALAASFPRQNVTAVKVDIHHPAETLKALKGATVLLNTLPYQYNLEVMDLALKLKAHYVDLGGLFHMTRKQLELHEAFVQAGLTAIVGMGAAPGITNLLAKHAADALDTVQEIHIRLGGLDRTRYRPKPVLAVSYSFKTILEEFSWQPALFTKGRFRFVKPMSGRDPHRFPKPIGIQYPMYTLHSEVATLPLSYKSKGVQEVSFKIAFPPEFVTHVQFLRDLGLAAHEPVNIQGQAIAPVDVVNHVVMNQPTPVVVGEVEQYEVLRAVVKGILNGKKITRIVDCFTQGMPAWGIGTDIDTGTPPAIAAQMLVNGQIHQRGVLAPEVAIDPALFFAELEKRQMFVTSEDRAGWRFKV
jgi:saccharopine dehydrogenase-like NADP-dependent oxidoreductase